MANEIVTKHIHEDLYSYSISYDAGSDCGPVSGKHLTGGRPTTMRGQEVVKFDYRVKGQDVALTYATRPDLADLVAQYNAREADEQTARDAARAVRQAAQDEMERPLLAAMEQEITRLRSLIPADHVEVIVTKVGDFDGIPNLEYVADGVEVRWSDVIVHGWASATRPGAMGAFAEMCIASISRTKLVEIKAAQDTAAWQKIEAEEQAKKELAHKFETARVTSTPVEIESFMAECDNPREECNTDVVTVYAMPDGSTKTERQHTW